MKTSVPFLTLLFLPSQLNSIFIQILSSLLYLIFAGKARQSMAAASVTVWAIYDSGLGRHIDGLCTMTVCPEFFV